MFVYIIGKLILNYFANFSGPKICPVDNSPLTLDHIFRDAFCNREILDLECYCNCKPLGCEWTGQLRNMEVFNFRGVSFFSFPWSSEASRCSLDKSPVFPGVDC